MHLIGNKVVQLEEIDVTHRDFLCKWLARPTVKEDALTGLFTAFGKFGLTKHFKDFFLCCTIKYRRFHPFTEFMARPSEMNFQDLTDVHSRGHT